MPLSWGYHNWTYRLLTGRSASPTSILAQLASLGISAFVIGTAGNIQPALADEPLLAATEVSEDSNQNGPIVTILQPTYSALLKGKQQIVIGVQTRLHPAKAVEMYVDDQLATPGAVPLDAVPQAAFDWDTAKFADGPHLLRVTVTDTQGFIGQAEVRIYVNNGNKRDVVPPALDWLNLRTGDMLSGMKNVELKAVDNFGVKYIFVFLNPAATPKRRPALRSWLLNRPPYLIPLDTLKVTDGLYALDAIALDPLDNEGLASTLFIGVSNHSINKANVQDQLNALIATLPVAPPVAPVADPPAAPVDQNPVALPAVPDPAPVAVVQGEDPPSTGEQPRIEWAPPATEAPGQPLPGLSALTRDLGQTSTGMQSGALSVRTSPAQSRAGQIGLSVSSPLLVPRPLPRTAKPVPRTGRTKGVVKAPTRMPSLVKVPKRGKVPAAAIARALPPHPVPRSVQEIIGVPELSATGKPVGAFTGAFTAPLAPGRDRGELVANAVRPTAPKLAGRAPQIPVAVVPAHVPTAPLLSTATQDVNTFTGAFTAPQRITPRKGRTSKSLLSSSPRTAMLPPMTPRRGSTHAAITVARMPQNSLAAIYVTRRNESLISVAQRCKLPIAALAAANKLAPTAQLRKGAHVRLPQPVALSYHGQPVGLDVPSLMVGSTTMTPFRFLFEQQGGSLIWDAKHQRVLARDAKHEVVVTIGSRTAIVNKKETMMNLAAFLMSGRTMVPVRFFEKALHAQVEWEPSTGRLFVAMAS